LLKKINFFGRDFYNILYNFVEKYKGYTSFDLKIEIKSGDLKFYKFRSWMNIFFFVGKLKEYFKKIEAKKINIINKDKKHKKKISPLIKICLTALSFKFSRKLVFVLSCMRWIIRVKLYKKTCVHT